MDRRAQKQLYDQYAPAMLGVCRRYLRDLGAAEDALLEGFFKILTRLESYTGEGSFAGWMRRIMVNECLMHLRQRNLLQFPESMPQASDGSEDDRVLSRLSADEIISLLDEMPPGYRAVFNLYVMEGFKHREIAEVLGISINTSKSQLVLAKQKMELLVKTRLGIKNEEV